MTTRLNINNRLKIALVALMAILFGSTCYGQNASSKGALDIVDTTQTKPNSVRMAVRKQDSSLVLWNMIKWRQVAYLNSSGAALTLAPIGSSPNANGATISGSTFNLQPASSSFGGVLTNGTQSISGAKTFISDLAMSSSLIFPALQYNSTATSKYGKLPDGTRLQWVRDDTTYHSTGGPLCCANYFWGRNAGNLSAAGGGSNIGLQDSALNKITTGFGNAAIGEQALANVTNSNYSIGIGYYAGNKNNASGLIAIGDKAAQSNTTGTFNVAIGTSALKDGTNQTSNVGVGTSVLQETAIGSYNTGMGSGVFTHMYSGSKNTGFGWHIHHYGLYGENNTYVGYAVSETETLANNNAFFGYYAMHYNTGLDSMIVLNSLDRTNLTGDTTNSPVVIFEDPVVANQRINLNGNVAVAGNITATNLPVILSGSASLGFGTLGSFNAASLTITVTGAAVGDVVALGIPSVSMNTAGTDLTIYNAYVSSTNTVTVRCFNASSGPESIITGTFKVKVFK